MKPIYLHLVDPSGHKRVVKLSRFPLVLGTNLSDKNQFRDHALPELAIQIVESEPGVYRLHTLSPNLSIRLGDLKFHSLELPYFVTLKMGETEFHFSPDPVAQTPLEFPASSQAWYTESKSGVELLTDLRKSSATKLSIYLSGETGTGKEVLANLVHLWSDRAQASFVPINCGALALSLAESELFGHVKGAFTGAVRDRPGALLQAHGGTLFLDEVGDLPLELQVKLLRFLESGEIRPVGSDRTLFADVRVVCATHKPLLELVHEKKFRQDLYFRLASIPIEIPSLRDRPEDIRALSTLFAKKQAKVLTEVALTRLQSYSWPGNVRELRHAIDRACGLAGTDETLIHSKSFDFLKPASHSAFRNLEPLGVNTLKEMEKILILKSLKRAKGNRTDAAKILGIARSTLFEMMKRHQIIGPKAADLWVVSLTH